MNLVIVYYYVNVMNKNLIRYNLWLILKFDFNWVGIKIYIRKGRSMEYILIVCILYLI